MADTFRIGYTKDFLNAKGEVGWGDIALDLYEGVPGIEFSYLGEDERVLTPANAGDYDALGVLAPRITAELLDNAPRLAVVARFGVGYDSVDLDACTRNGVAVTITPDGVRRPMAATAMTFMLALAHRVIEKDRLTREGGWGRKLDYMGVGVTGKTLGTIGLGNIARDLIGLAKPWGMRHIAHDPYVTPEQAAALGVELVDLETLLRESDFVVVLCKLTDETHHLIDAERLASMKPSAFLISIARGPIVDEAALYEALRTHKIRGAGMDVFEQEPVDPANPILQLDNVIVAPHALCWTDECAYGNGAGVANSILAVREGRVPEHVVNREVIDTPRFREKLAAYRARWGN
jgi:phosphoglycerate dehydrogenase-like enzyme